MLTIVVRTEVNTDPNAKTSLITITNQLLLTIN